MIQYFFLVLMLFMCSFKSIGQNNNLVKKTDSLVHDFFSRHPNVPGLSIAVVDGNGVLFMKGYGWANKEKKIQANEHTLFYIASATKSFTALMAGLLDRDKKMLLERPFRSYVPGVAFRSNITDSITIRNLLSHTSGLFNPIMVHRYAYTGDIHRPDMLKVLADMTEVKDRPGKYHYDNLGYNIYGLLMMESLGLDWRNELERLLFKPLKMNSTTAYISRAKKHTDNIAVPYSGFGEKGMERMSLEKVDNSMQSAGGLLSSVSDLSRWLLMQVNNGKLEGKQIIPADIIQATRAAYATGVKGSFPFDGTGGYGLGWFLNEYAGQKVIYHFGGYPGFKSHVSFMPEKRVGVAILVNEGVIGSAFVDMLAMFIYDNILGTSDVEKKFSAIASDFDKRSAQIKERNDRHYKTLAERKWQLSLPLQTYLGKYYNSYLGTMELFSTNDTIVVKHGNLRSVSNPFVEKETIRVELIPGEGTVIAFKVEGDKVVALKHNGVEYVRK